MRRTFADFVNEILMILGESTGEQEVAIIATMAIMMILAGLCSVVFHAIKLPPIIGYLIAGILIVNVFNMKDNPSFDKSTVEVLKSLGLVMLMFCIGTELSFEKIKKTGKFAAIVAVIQLPLMVLSGFIFGQLLFGLDAVGAITLGAVISGSSTAVVTAILKSQGRISKEDAETLILVTIVEDIGQVVILSMVTPLFVGGNIEATEMVGLIVAIIIFMAVSIIVGVKIIPKFLDWLGDKTAGEIVLIFSIGLCFGMAWLSKSIGMSEAIGAFLMGMMMSQSKHTPSLEKKIEPMKDLFMAVFFISVGMEVTFSGFVSSLPMAIGILIVFMLSKFATVFIGYFVGGKNFELSFVSSVSLMAMGEFAFIISSEAYSKGAVSEGFYSAVIGAALMSMVILPILSKKMFVPVDAYERSNGRFKRLSKRAFEARDTINNRMETSPKLGEIISKSLKKSYVCILLIIVIEIIFSSLGTEIDSFITSIISQYVQFDNLETIVHLGVMTLNFILLVYPTYVVISSFKFIGKVLKESNRAGKKQTFLDVIVNISTIAVVFVIDFVLMAIVPGPFGGKGSLVVIPISIIVFFVITFIAWKLAKRKSKKIKPPEEIIY